METWIQEVYRAVSRGEPAVQTFEAEGVTCVRSFRPPERLILLGGGHVAQPLCRYAADLGFAVTVVDDRPSFANTGRFPEAAEVICRDFPGALRQLRVNERDYVSVITRGHRYDADCLRTILSGPFPRYLGMIGSRRRVAGLLRLLEEEGLVRSHAGGKRFVCATRGPGDALRRELTENELRGMVRDMKRLGLTAAEAALLVEKLYAEEESE